MYIGSIACRLMICEGSMEHTGRMIPSPDGLVNSAGLSPSNSFLKQVFDKAEGPFLRAFACLA
jgi:hypothetical protein